MGLPQLGSDMRVVDLRCEYLSNPLGVDVVQPRLSWKLESQLARPEADRLPDPRGQQRGDCSKTIGRTCGIRQGRIRPVDPRRLLRPAADVADPLLLEGARLGRGRQAQPVQRGRPRGRWACSTPEDWKAKWITAPRDTDARRGRRSRRRCFARRSSSPSRSGSARLYICGLGYHELRLNGSKVGDHVLDPAFTRYDRRALYVTHDVTEPAPAGRQRRRA